MPTRIGTTPSSGASCRHCTFRGDSVRCAPVLDRQAWALLRRLTRWLDQFKDCFGHRAQHVSLRQYVDGVLGDGGRKSMSAMLERVTEPTSYQAFQHFITHAPWDADAV